MGVTLTPSGKATAIHPVRRAPALSASVAEQLLTLIVDGGVGLGERLPSEIDLARDFGVSRPSIREGLAALAFAGLIESRRGFGTIVISTNPSTGRTGQAGQLGRPDHIPRLRDGADDTAPPRLKNLTEAVDLLELRLLLEPAAMASAANDPDLAKLGAARSVVAGMRVAVEEPMIRASTDIRVHRALLELCGNTVLRRSAMDALELSLDPLLVQARTKAWASDELPLCWADQHLAVCDAIAAGDPETARAASRRHLGSVVENIAAAAEGHPGLQRRLADFMTDPATETESAIDEGDDHD